MLPVLRSFAAAVAVAALATACGSSAADTDTNADKAPGTDTDTDAADEQMFPDIVDATAREVDGGWTFDVTVSSPYDTPERYADGWRVIGADDTVYGIHTLTHDHAGEQPFTRSLSGVQIPAEVDVVTIEGRDQVHGFGGITYALTLPRS